MAANGTNTNFVDTAKWQVDVEGDGQRRTTKFLVKRTPVIPSEGNPPDLPDSTAVTVAIVKAAIEYGGIEPADIIAGYNPRNHYYAGAPFQSYRVKTIGVWLAEVTLTYGWNGVNSAATGTPNLTFKRESSLETVEIKRGIGNRVVYAATGAPTVVIDGDQYDTILNPNIEGQSQGLQIQVSTTRFSWSFKLDYEDAKALYYMLPWGATDPGDAVPWDLFSNEYEEIEGALTGLVNDGVFAGRPAGCARYDGGSGTVNDRGEMDYTWSFTRKRLNIPTGLPPMEIRRVGGSSVEWDVGSAPAWWTADLVALFGSWGSIDVEANGVPAISPAYDGWDALSIIYDLTETPDEVEVAPRVKVASVIQYLPRGNFDYLRIPGVTPAVPAPEEP